MREGETPQPAEIVSVGLVTPVGLHAAAAHAAIEAGRNRASRIAFIGRPFDEQAMHLVDDEHLGPLAQPLESLAIPSAHRRMLRLGGPGLAEAASVAVGAPPLLLALPAATPGSQDSVGSNFIPQLALQAGIDFDESRSAIYRLGGAGVLYALRDALTLLATKQVLYAIVGAVDTFLDLRRLALLDSERRLYGPSSRLGFVPGEGAGFLLLRAAQPKQTPGTRPALARVMGVGTAEERGHRYSTTPYRGDGLADAFQSLFQQLPSSQPKVRRVYAGFNGEELPAKEWGVARVRNSEQFIDEPQVEHPADCIGDSGAALGAIMLGLAAIAINQGHAPEPHPIWFRPDPGPCLIWSTSDREPRGAALLQH